MIRTLVYISLFILAWQPARGQGAYIFYADSPFRYWAAEDEVPADWFSTDFDDNAWPLDTGTIGFGGHNFDVTIPASTRSLYLRYQFTMNNPDAVKALSLMADFDDGYIAYLNGKEILRKNIPDSLPFTSYNTLSNRSHAPRSGSQLPVYAYYLDSSLLDTTLVQGINVLAIQVVNDSVDGSDLYFSLSMYNVTTAQYNLQRSLFRYKRKMNLDSTYLPLVILETGERGIPYKRVEVPAYMGIIANSNGGYNKPTDSCNVYSGMVNIEVRGESSATFPKRSYEFEFKDSVWNDSNVAILGMPAESDWILQGPWADKSQIRNAMIFELGRKTGHWAPRTVFCEVVLNGDFIGLYTLTEEIKRDPQRVDIARLRPEETSGLDLTGGYIMKYDKPNSTLEVVYPNVSNLQAAQEEYLMDYVLQYRRTLLSNEGLDPLEGYSSYIDAASLIDLVIISELGKNCDSYLFSSYLYKDRDDRDGKIKFGPLWDFDLCFGNSIWQEGYNYHAWQWEYPANNRFEIKRLFEDTELVNAFAARWIDLRTKYLHTDSLMNLIDTYVAELGEAIERNYQVWPVIDKDVFYEAYSVASYEQEIDYMKSWIRERLDWMDENIPSIYYPVTDYSGIDNSVIENLTRIRAYPNPFDDHVFIDLSLSASCDVRLEVLSAQGAHLADHVYEDQAAGDYTFELKELATVPPGVYLVGVFVDDSYSHQLRIMKVE